MSHIMFIRFTCPLCKKGLKVKQELAGKRVKCAACQKPIQVPALPPTPPSAQASHRGVIAATPAHAEELAAQVFGDEPKPLEEKNREGAPIKFNCYYCDEEVTFSAELAGKQAPCPSCRRIIKVPLPVKEGPKDWRTVQTKGPSAAKQNLEPAPEGVWSASAKSTVSEEALMEADAIVEEVEPLSRQEKVRRWFVRVGAVLILAGLGSGAWHMYTANKQEKTFQRALQFVAKDKISPEVAAVVHRYAGEYYLRTGEVNEQGQPKAADEFKMARGSLAARPGAADVELVDLAVAQADLGEVKSFAKERGRLKWEETQNELRQTLQKLSTFEAREEALRLVARKLVARSQESEVAKQELRGRPEALARLLSASPQELPELLAIVGLELLKVDPKHAEDVAHEASQPYLTAPAPAAAATPAKPAAPVAPAAAAPGKPTEAKTAPPPKPPVAPSLLALLLALKQDAKAYAVALPAPRNAPTILGEIRYGYALGWAHQGKWDDALAYAAIGGDPNQRLQTLVAVAEVALEKSPENAKRVVTAALDLVEREKPHNAPWALRQLGFLAARAGFADKAQALADKLAHPGLKSEVQLAVLQGRLDQNAPADMGALVAEAAKKSQAHARTLAFLSRHNAFQGSHSAVINAAAEWESEALQAVGFIGAALGMQDSAVGTQQVAHKK